MLNLEEKKHETFWKSKKSWLSFSLCAWSISSYMLAQSSFKAYSCRSYKSLKETFLREKLIILVVPMNSLEKLKYFSNETEVMSGCFYVKVIACETGLGFEAKICLFGVGWL